MPVNPDTAILMKHARQRVDRPTFVYTATAAQYTGWVRERLDQSENSEFTADELRQVILHAAKTGGRNIEIVETAVAMCKDILFRRTSNDPRKRPTKQDPKHPHFKPIDDPNFGSQDPFPG